MLKLLLLGVILGLLVENGSAAMNEKQVKAAAKLVRNSCQPKMKISDGNINNI